MLNRRLVLAGLAGATGLLLSACGFTPLYSTAGYDQLAGLEVNAGGERFDYLVQDAVRDFAGPGSSPYALLIETAITDQPTGLSPTGAATRNQLVVTAIYRLDGPGAHLSGRRTASIAFDQPGDPYALLAARSEAEERLAGRLAEEILQEIAVELRRRQAGSGR